MSSPESERVPPKANRSTVTANSSIQTGDLTRSSPVSLRSGLWLLVDALVILGVATGVAAWFLTENRTTFVICEVIAGAACTASGVLAFNALRRTKRPSVPAGAGPADSDGNRRAGASPNSTALRIDGEAIDNLRAFHKLIAQKCCEHSDGSGKVRGDASRSFFAQLDLANVEPLIAASELRTANDFQRLLDRIASGIGSPSSPQLDQLRSSIPAALGPTLARVAENLATTNDLQGFREGLVDSCFEHSDGRGVTMTWGLSILLSRVTPEQLKILFGPARPKALAAMARIVGILTRRLTTPCAELEVLRSAIIDAGRSKLPVSQQAEWLIPFIAGLCCERADGSGRVDREAARRLFDGLTFNRLGDRLSHVPIRELNTVALALSRIAAGLEEPQPAGFRGLIKAVDESIELAAIHLQPTLLTAPSLDIFRRVLVDACCECDDASGFHNRRALHAIFEGVDVERFVPLIAAATSTERLQLSQLVNRIDMDRRGESASPAVQKLRDLLAASVESDRSADRTRVAEQALAQGGESGAQQIVESLADITLTWQHFKQANLVTCSPELAQRFAKLLDDIAADGEEGLRRIVRRLWVGLRRDGERLMVDLPREELAGEWVRKRFLADALARGADRRAVPKLVALLEADCDDSDYRDTVQPAIARALVAMRDKRAVEALRRAKQAAYTSSATKRVIAASKHKSRREGELPT